MSHAARVQTSRAPRRDQERNLHLPCSPNYSNLLTPLRCGEMLVGSSIASPCSSDSPYQLCPCCLSRPGCTPGRGAQSFPQSPRPSGCSVSSWMLAWALQDSGVHGACWPGGKRLLWGLQPNGRKRLCNYSDTEHLGNSFPTRLGMQSNWGETSVPVVVSVQGCLLRMRSFSG